MKKALYTIEGLKHWYNQRIVVDIPELSIEPGAAIGFVGQNGCGKSTLLRILAFLEPPKEGTVQFKNDKTVDGANRNSIAFLLQEPYLLKRSVFQNIAYGLKVRKDTDNLKHRVGEFLELVGLDPVIFINRQWHELSGGEAQRVALASRLILRPDVLILDEPTASVDKVSASLIKETVMLTKEQTNATLLVASHDILWLSGITDEILHLHDGKIIGTENYNIINGPWVACEDNLAYKQLPDGHRIVSACPPSAGATALLNPSHIIVSKTKPENISAQNIIPGTIIAMSKSPSPGIVKMEVDAARTVFSCVLTEHAVLQNQYVPGSNVYLIFKASSIQWD